MREQIQKLYPRAQWETQVARYQEGAEQFRKLFGYDHAYIFSAPGRSEICGNHTDHNLGKAVGAAIDLDVLAFVGPREDSIITIHSEGYAPFMVDLTDLSLQESEKGSSSALVRGIAYKMAATDRKIGGFDAYTTSNVCKGSGLSSSAAFEVTIVSILDHLYNNGELPAMEMAKIAQFAENVYFGKASGLLDQLSCAHGGMIAIDFQDPDHPIATPLPFDFNQTGYDLVITDVGTDHADLTADYVAIKEEMESIAAFFGEKYLRKVDPNAFYQKLPHLRENISERALLRAIHFFQEN
ncbi:MAG: galactokinase, partial [Clostridia bacterium]|nr:galactokinase [Clostridia bacterium]